MNVGQRVTTKLTASQAMEVARRLNPQDDQPLRFRSDGSVANDWLSVADWNAAHVEVWQCTRRGNVFDVFCLTA